MNKTFLALLLVSLNLTGCTAGVQNQTNKLFGIKYYKDTLAPEKARLRVFKNDQTKYTIYPSGCYSSKDPDQGILSTPVVSAGSLKNQIFDQNNQSLHEEKSLGMPHPAQLHNMQSYEYYVPANKKVLLDLAAFGVEGTSTVRCTQNLAVTFEPNKDYELRDISRGVSRCAFSLTEIQTDGTRVAHKQQSLVEWKEATCRSN
jgi:hypothetical protein